MDARTVPGPADRRARVARMLCVGVAGLEAVVLGLASVVAVVTGLQGGSAVLGVAVGATGLVVAYLMAAVAVGFRRRQRWPRGVFVTVQVLVVLVALSIGSPSLLAFSAVPRIASLTALALAVGVAGLVGVALGGGSLVDAEEEPGPGR